MADNDSPHTFADYVAIVVSPVLIMALVGSLVFFLVEVLLGPTYPEQLLWILFAFVFAAVLIARISMMKEIAGRAGVYGLIVAVLVWFSLKVYVKYPPASQLAAFDWLINTILIGIIWGSAHRLTWDSTLVDDTVDASGTGLLQEAGLEQADEQANKPEPAVDKERRRKREPGGFLGWVERIKRYRAEVGKRPHAPGVWIVYFSLAALPLFGLGQSLIPIADTARRRYAFWLLVVYVASGLGLLLTTSFVNLRRYLRQRKLAMPAAMVGVWLTAGVLIIALLLALGALIPRPSAEYPLVDLGATFGVQDRESSQQAQGKGWATGKGSGAEGPRDKDGGDKSKGGDKAGHAKGDDKGGKGGGQKEDKNASGDDGTSPNKELSELGKKLLTVLKWIVGGLIVLIILFLVGRALLRFLANFTHWAKHLLDSWNRFWERWRRWWQGRGLPEAVIDEPESAKPPKPFVTYRDPFRSGEAERMSPGEMVRYTFESLESWAHDRGCGRHVGETPLEFVGRLTQEYPALETAANHLVGLYLGLAYARQAPAAEGVEELREFWRLLVDLVERPMSAA